MKKLFSLLLIFISVNMLAQEDKLGAIYFGNVENFARTNKDYTNTITIDTIVGQGRVIKIAGDHSLFELGWHFDDSYIFKEYYIEKIFTSTNKNEKLNTINNHYVNYVGFDEDHYPLLLMMSFDNTHCYLFYYWDGKEKMFLKSEKVVFSAVTNESIDQTTSKRK